MRKFFLVGLLVTQMVFGQMYYYRGKWGGRRFLRSGGEVFVVGVWYESDLEGKKLQFGAGGPEISLAVLNNTDLDIHYLNGR
ncbi:MAG: hypothetical protein IPN60_16870 [Saprospiraceae bacterium]|nr:hypothetical protein [Candidatus Opimibacter skivensis]